MNLCFDDVLWTLGYDRLTPVLRYTRRGKMARSILVSTSYLMYLAILSMVRPSLSCRERSRNQWTLIDEGTHYVVPSYMEYCTLPLLEISNISLPDDRNVRFLSLDFASIPGISVTIIIFRNLLWTYSSLLHKSLPRRRISKVVIHQNCSQDVQYH